jgi:hypothetical protein
MKSNRTILAIALDIATCAGVLLTSATPSIRAHKEKAAASPAAIQDDSGKQAGTSGKVAAVPSYKAPTAPARAQERPKEESKKEVDKKVKKSKKAKKSKRDESGTEAGTSGKK